ncbi:hypothetical protein [Pseudomonas tumuqii]|uniref:hypothetical protein n=1 Tax=Pseudomonas tumuqii TaxID=2715755 RepID=UPI0015571AAC|nr:hypothetical protein [Pseudomonas tumuqii]
MITLQINLPDQTLANAIAAATKHGLSLDDYIDMQLSSGDFIPEATPAAPGHEPIEGLAQSLFDSAIELPEDGLPFLVEEIYKQLDLSPWEARSAGTRIRLGKAFMRLVKAQPEGGRVREDKIQVRIDSVGKTAQNQQLYRTVRVG